jgi:co-chaperonin GroES (HSP10)
VINKEFIKETDQLIKAIKKRKITLVNGNVLVAKVKVDSVTKGGIILTDDTKDLESKKNGFGRILALPDGFGQEGDAPLSVGQYVIYPHDEPYYPYVQTLRELLQIPIEDKFLYTVRDNNVLMTIPAEEIQ